MRIADIKSTLNGEGMIQRKARSDTEISKLIKQAKWNHTDWKSVVATS